MNIRRYLLILIIALTACSKEDKVLQAPPQVVTQSLVVNPIKKSPLTARLTVSTDVETRASILIKGQDGEDLMHDFDEFTRDHVIPILGLYPDFKNQVIVTLTSVYGEEVKLVQEIQTDPTPWFEFKDFKPVMSDPEKVGNGFIMLHLLGTDGLAGRDGLCPVMIDKFGKIRWLYKDDITHVFKKMSNGHFLTDGVSSGFWEIDLLGAKFGYWPVPEGIHHDAVETTDHSILFLSHAEGSTYDGVIEMDIRSGKYLNTWDLRCVLDPSRPLAPNDGPKEDWLHLNGIDYQKKDNSFIVSGRNQSSVVKIDKNSGKLKWILGNHEFWSDSLKPYLLTPIGDSFEWQWGQHAPMFNPEDPSKVLIFDNGCARSFTTPLLAKDNYSRVVEYKIDESAMTVEQVWQFGKEYGSELYSTYISNARYLDNGNVLICYGGITKNSNGEATDFGYIDICNSVRVLEIIPSTKEIVWDLKLEGDEENRKIGYRSYRAYKVDLYN